MYKKTTKIPPNQLRAILIFLITPTFFHQFIHKFMWPYFQQWQSSSTLWYKHTAPHNSSIRSDEGLTLETSAFKIFHGGYSTFINSFDKTQFLPHSRTDAAPQILLKLEIHFWYIGSGRSLSFCDIPQDDADTISINVLSCLNSILRGTHDKQKLVAQCYDSASVMSGQHRGAQSIVKVAYPNAHYVHFHSHQLNLVLQQAVSQITSLRVFFTNLNAFSVFFSRSPKRVSCLDDCVARRIRRSVQTRWNFQNRIVSTLFEHKDDWMKCFELIINTWRRSS